MNKQEFNKNQMVFLRDDIINDDAIRNFYKGDIGDIVSFDGPLIVIRMRCGNNENISVSPRSLSISP